MFITLPNLTVKALCSIYILTRIIAKSYIFPTNTCFWNPKIKNSIFEPSFNVDKILDITHSGNPRKAWSDISYIKLEPKMGFKSLEPDIRSSKSTNSNYISNMFKQSQSYNKLERKKFKEYVNSWLNTFAAEYLHFYSMLHDFEKFPLDSLVRNVLSNIDQIMGYYQVIDLEINKSTIAFIQSEYFKKIPIYNIEACLLSALQREAANGRKVLPSEGTANDILFISTYMPYCGAMFVDKEWGILLNQNPLKETFKDYKTQIFYMGNKENFINYLQELENKVPADILENARLLYKVD